MLAHQLQNRICRRNSLIIINIKLIIVLTASTAPTCCDLAASSFFPSSDARSIEPNSGPKIRLRFFRESSFSSSFSTIKSK